MRSSSDRVAEIIWCDPAAIEFKISPFLDLPSVKGGDWDIERRHDFKSTAKYRAIVQHFVEGRAWAETDLFVDVYRRRLERDGRIGRHRTLEALTEDYGRRFDGLFERLRRNGFRTGNGKGRNYALPAFLVGRRGEVFIGNQGNHRLAMAHVLGLDQIAGRVACRHEALVCRPVLGGAR